MNTPDLSTLLNAAIAMHQAGRFEDAERGYRLILTKDSKHADAWALLGCSLSEQNKHADAIAAIESALALDSAAPLFHFYLGNAASKAKKHQMAARAFEHATRLAPKWADAWYNLANAAREIDEKEGAKTAYQNTINLNPNHALAHNNLAQLYLKELNLNPARSHAEAALKLDPNNLTYLFTLSDVVFEQNELPTAFATSKRIAEIKLGLSEGDIGGVFKIADLNTGDEQLVNCLLTLAASYLLQEKLQEASALLRLLVAHEPNMAEALSLLGSTALRRNRLDEAGSYYAQCFMLDPSMASAPWNRSMVLLTRGNLREGFGRYRWRWHALEKFKRLALNGPYWDGRDLTGKTILVHEEQGYGDSLQMLRFVPLLKKRGAKVWLYARAPLYALIKDWDGADKIIEWKDFANKEFPEGVDFACGTMDLPGLLGIGLGNLPAHTPYLPNPHFADPNLKLEDGRGLKVGLVWSGNPEHKRDHERSIPFAMWKDIIKAGQAKGIQFFSLQFKAKEQDVQAMSEWGVTDLAPKIKNLADTAALLSQLDLLITVDSAPAHLAGALGVKVWTLVTMNPDWRWLLNRSDSPWYPSLQLFRQNTPHDWSPVMVKVKNAIEKLNESKKTLINAFE